jgi:glucose/arabinose dehydrogenase
MRGSDHSTRTLLLSRQVPGMLVIARGSFSNIDFEAAIISSGHSQVRAFNLNNRTGPYDYTSDGLRLGWGLRNEVGLAEHPGSGGIYGVENSADQQTRMGVDIHEDNPAEELNFFGYLNGTKAVEQGTNFGYPWCYSAWDLDALPDNGNLSVGSQYAIDATSDSNNENRTDAYCADQTKGSLVFQAHTAPLDIKFNNTGRQAWITFHGSWNRDDPIGYKLSLVQFHENGLPIDPVTSKTAARDILWNRDLSRCPDNCFRPVAMAIDQHGRIFMSSDASGEIYLISRTSGSLDGSATTSTTGAMTTGAAGSLMPPYSQWSYPLTVATYLAPLVIAFF